MLFKSGLGSGERVRLPFSFSGVLGPDAAGGVGWSDMMLDLGVCVRSEDFPARRPVASVLWDDTGVYTVGNYV